MLLLLFVNITAFARARRCEGFSVVVQMPVPTRLEDSRKRVRVWHGGNEQTRVCPQGVKESASCVKISNPERGFRQSQTIEQLHRGWARYGNNSHWEPFRRPPSRHEDWSVDTWGEAPKWHPSIGPRRLPLLVGR